MTTEILEAHRAALETDEHLDWALLLRICASFEPYCKHHTAVVEPVRVMNFLIYEPESPHTLRFSAEMLRNGLNRIDPAGGALHPLGSPHRIAGQLRSLLAYSPGREDTFEETLAEVRRLARNLHEEIYQRYIVYAVDQALRIG